MPLRIFAALFAVAVLAMSLGGAYWVWQHEFVEEAIAVEEMAELEEAALPKPDPGLGRYELAMAEIRQGDLLGGRDTLLDLVRVYKDSSRFDEAKRVIGEINMDLLLSSDLIAGKREYIVQSGDSLLAIAGRNSCTLDYLMRVNNLFGSTIQPGQRMIVMPLEFSLIVHLKDVTLTLMRKGKFYKEYSVEGHNIPPVAAGVRETTVTSRSAWKDRAKVRFPSPDYHSATKWIQFSSPGLLITGLPEGWVQDLPGADDDAGAALEEERDVGIFLSETDVEELFTVLPYGTKVTLIR